MLANSYCTDSKSADDTALLQDSNTLSLQDDVRNTPEVAEQRSSSRSKLLELPLELREMIYQHILFSTPYDHTTRPRTYRSLTWFDVLPLRYSEPLTCATDLQCTCKQVYSELQWLWERPASAQQQQQQQQQQRLMNTWRLRIEVGRRRPDPRVGWRTLPCPPRHMRHLVLEVHPRGRQEYMFDEPYHEWSYTPMTLFDRPGMLAPASKLRCVLHLLGMIRHRGAALTAEAPLATPLRIPAVEIVLCGAAISPRGRRQWDWEQATLEWHRECCLGRGVEPDGHELFERFVYMLTGELARERLAMLCDLVVVTYDNSGVPVQRSFSPGKPLAESPHAPDFAGWDSKLHLVPEELPPEPDPPGFSIVF